LISIAFSNNLIDILNTLLISDIKKDILNKPDERFVSTYNLLPTFNSSFAFRDSLILTQNEAIYLTQILEYPFEVKLLYRATRDGFQASNFRSKCRGISNTLTIVKTTSNSVFGGYTSALWANDDYNYDENAFIFTLRRLGNLNRQRFNVSDPEHAIYSGRFDDSDVISFGLDLHIKDYSNQNENSYSNLEHSYQLPNNTEYGTGNAQSVLAGSSSWKTTEIEVYQITPFISYSVTPLHNGFFLYKFN
jgi:hypothetical protein